MADIIEIEIKGLKELIKNMDSVGPDLPPYMRGAGIEVSGELLSTPGLQNYPPATEANRPPTPYYIRGRGMQTSPSRNDGSSQRLGTRWENRRSGTLGTVIRNPVTYAEWVHGLNQARAMMAIGWRILFEVATEKTDMIASIYDKWIGKLLKNKGL